MKVISLLQPWATLVVIGAKTIETRSRRINYRGKILIHASQGKAGEIFAYDAPFRKYVQDFHALPFGAIVGYATLTKVLHTEDFNFNDEVMDQLTMEEKAFGDYTSGRYGYVLENAVEFKKPIPTKGQIIVPWEFRFPGNDESFIMQCQDCGLTACADHFVNSKTGSNIQGEEEDAWCPVCESRRLETIIENIPW